MTLSLVNKNAIVTGGSRGMFLVVRYLQKLLILLERYDHAIEFEKHCD